MADNYIICSTQRSGSTFFCKSLAAINLLGNPDEHLVFLEYDPAGISPRQRALRDLPVAQIIEAQKQAQIDYTGNAVTGWKVMWSTMRVLNGRLGVDPSDSPALFGVFEKHLDAPRYIFFQRENKVAQAISHIVMKRMGVAHINSSADLEAYNRAKEALTIPEAEISANIHTILVHEQRWRHFFEVNRITPLPIFYEELCANVGDTLAEVAEFLNLGEALPPLAASAVNLRKTRSNFERDQARRYLTAISRPAAKDA